MSVCGHVAADAALHARPFAMSGCTCAVGQPRMAAAWTALIRIGNHALLPQERIDRGSTSAFVGDGPD